MFERRRGRGIAFCLVFWTIVGAPGLFDKTAFGQQIDGPNWPESIIKMDWGSTFEVVFSWFGVIPVFDITSLPDTSAIPAPTSTDTQYYFELDTDEFAAGYHFTDSALAGSPPYLMDAMMGWLVIGEVGGNIRVFDPLGNLVHTSTGLNVTDVGWGPDEEVWILNGNKLFHYEYEGPAEGTTSNPFSPFDPTFDTPVVFAFSTDQPMWSETGPWEATTFVFIVFKDVAGMYQIRKIQWFEAAWTWEWTGCPRTLGPVAPIDITVSDSWDERFFVIYDGDDTVYELDGLCGTSTIAAADAGSGVSGPRNLFFYHGEWEDDRLAVLMDDGVVLQYDVNQGEPAPYSYDVLRPATTTADWSLAQDRYDLNNFYAIADDVPDPGGDVDRLTRYGAFRFQCDTTSPIHIVTVRDHEPAALLYFDTESEGLCQTGADYWYATQEDERMGGFIVDYAEVPGDPGFDLTTSHVFGPFPEPYDITVSSTVPGEIEVIVDHAAITSTLDDTEYVNIYAVMIEDDEHSYNNWYGGGCRPCGFAGLSHCHGHDELYRNYHRDDFHHAYPALIATAEAVGSQTTVTISDLPEDTDIVITAAMAWSDREWVSSPLGMDEAEKVTTASGPGVGSTCTSAIVYDQDNNPFIHIWGGGDDGLGYVNNETWFANILPSFGNTTWYEYQAPATGVVVAMPEMEEMMGWVVGAAYETCDPLVPFATLDLSYDGLWFEVVDGQTYYIQLTTFGIANTSWYGLLFPLDALVAENFVVTGDEGFVGSQNELVTLTWDAPERAQRTLFNTTGFLTYHIRAQEQTGDPSEPVFDVFPIEQNRTAHWATVWPLPSDTIYEFYLHTVLLLPNGDRVIGPEVSAIGSTSSDPGPTGLDPITSHVLLLNGEARDLYVGALIAWPETGNPGLADRYEIVASSPGWDDTVRNVTGGRLAAAVPIPGFGVWDLTLTAHNDRADIHGTPTPFPVQFDACALAQEFVETPPPGDPWYVPGQFDSNWDPNNNMDNLQLNRPHFFRFNPGVDPSGENLFYLIGYEPADIEVFEGTDCTDLSFVTRYEYVPAMFDFYDISLGFPVDTDPATSLFFLVTPIFEIRDYFEESIYESDPGEAWMTWMEMRGGFGLPRRPAPGFGAIGNPNPQIEVDVFNTCANRFDFTITVAPPPGFYEGEPVPFVVAAMMLDEDFDSDDGPDPDALEYVDFDTLGTESWTSPPITDMVIDPDAAVGALMVMVMAEAFGGVCGNDDDCGPGMRCSGGDCHENCNTYEDCPFDGDWCDGAGMCQWDEQETQAFAFELVRFFAPPPGDTNSGCIIDVTDVVNFVRYFWASRPPTPDYDEMALAIPSTVAAMDLDVAQACIQTPRTLENCITMGYAVAVAQLILDTWVDD